MLGIFSLKRITRNNKCGKASSAEENYIKIRNIYYNFIYALEKNDEEKFRQAAPDELIGCRPITKNGSIQNVRTVFFRRNELTVVA